LGGAGIVAAQMGCQQAAVAAVAVPMRPPPAAQPAPAQPSCTVDVGYLPNVFGTQYSHAYIDVTVAGMTKYVEASPSFGVSILPTMKVNITSTGIYNDSTKGIDFWSEQGQNVCVDAVSVLQDATSFPAAYYLGLISNSNSFASTILGEAGVAAPKLVNGPPNAIGWGGGIAYIVPIL
jgi:hypothetical protein